MKITQEQLQQQRKIEENAKHVIDFNEGNAADTAKFAKAVFPFALLVVGFLIYTLFVR